MALAVALMSAFGPFARADDRPGLVQAELIYEEATFPQCHASTIAESGGRLVAAWFGGTQEGAPDVGIWFSRHDGKKWSAPVEVASGVHDGRRDPCWNPVLFQPANGPLLLFYKVGPSPSAWWGLLKTSTDGGATWSAASRLPDGILGPIKDKPSMLAGGVLLCPSSTEDHGWRIHFERTADLGRTWERTAPVNDGVTYSAIQPTVMTHPGGRMQALCRSKQSKILETWSDDGGKTWSPLTPTSLPNNDSGLDAVTLTDGRHLLVYNHTTEGRTPLNLAVSPDGKTWKSALVLEGQPGEYSYPAIIQTSDGLLHVTYTYNRRRVKHLVVDPGKIEEGELPGMR